MASLYQRPRSSLWQISYQQWSDERQAMVRVRVSSGTNNREEAEAMAEGLEVAAKAARSLAGSVITKEHAHGLFLNLLSVAGIAIEGNRKLPFLADFLDAYAKSRIGKVAQSTLDRYRTDRNNFDKWLVEMKAEKSRLDWLTRERCEEYYQWLAGRMAPKSSRETFKWLARAMKRAVETTSLEKNPCNGIEMNSKGETLDRLPFTMAEAFALVEWLCNQGDREREWARCAALSLMSGCRIGDAIRMKREMINDGVLTYTQEKGGKAITCPLVVSQWLALIEEAKSGPIAPQLYKEFTQWGNADLSTEFTKFVEDADITQKFQTFKSGKRMARKTFHSLRHTLRTAIVQSGGSDAQADVILGHSEGEGKRYTHSEVDAMRGTLSKALKA